MINICNDCKNEHTCKNKPMSTTRCRDFKWKTTIGDHIRSLNNEEMAKFFEHKYYCPCYGEGGHKTCLDEHCGECWLRELDKEYKDETENKLCK